MRKTTLSSLGVATLLVWAVVPSRAFTPPVSAVAQDPDRPVAQDQDRDQDRDRDSVRPELANFDVFLDGHPEIAEQLKKDPNLINDKEFIENHPQLRDYLNDHPNVREDLREHPRAFMNGESRFDRREDARGDNDMMRSELRNFDGFLDNHPNIQRQLSKDPSLVNNEEYLDKHPELSQFLKSHPDLTEQLRENPRAFMRDERRFDDAEEKRDMDKQPPPVRPVDKH